MLHNVKDNYIISVKDHVSQFEEKSFRKLARAFDNFKAFLIVNTTNIDHTYLWDFICDSEIHDVHPNGINLIILDND